MKQLKTLFFLILSFVFVSNAIARDQIKIVGSSTVYPYATVVAERFGKSGKFKTNFDLGFYAHKRFDEELEKYSYNWRAGGEYTRNKNYKTS